MCVWVFLSTHTLNGPNISLVGESVKYRYALLQLLIRCQLIWRACQVTLAKTLRAPVKNTHTHRSQQLGAGGGWQRRAPRGTNTDSRITAHPRPYLPKTNHPLLTNKHICFTNKLAYIICQTVGSELTFIVANCFALKQEKALKRFWRGHVCLCVGFYEGGASVYLCLYA